jgi:hypothetical protein
MPWRKICLSALILYSPFALASPHFESSEHTTAGNYVKLFFKSDDPGTKGIPLHVANHSAYTYGDIVALGDFYEVVGQPISQGKDDAERKSRFLAAFNLFAEKTDTVDETQKLLAVFQNELKAVQDGMDKGENPSDIYKKIANDNNRQYNCITGGGCDEKNWWLRPGRYVTLANQNFSHFGDDAVLSYQAGHQAALDEAVLAHQTKDPAKLEIAYAMNAFASHFLSDRFASGHMRTPRNELYNFVTPHALGSLLGSYMHTEESYYGLRVRNKRGDQWVAYGDRYYFELNNETNKKMLHEALQRSADEIFSTYQTGEMPAQDTVAELIPTPRDKGPNRTIDVCSMFFANSLGYVLRRQDLSDINDEHWTTHWSPLLTLATLAKLNGELSTLDQAELVRAGFGEKASEYGLITDKNIANFVRNRGKI